MSISAEMPPLLQSEDIQESDVKEPNIEGNVGGMFQHLVEVIMKINAALKRTQ